VLLIGKIYEDKSLEDKERRSIELKKYQESKGPKKPLTAFMLFANTIRPSIRAEHPDLPVTEMGKKIGERWAALSDTDKKVRHTSRCLIISLGVLRESVYRKG
jgi:hypothetical protein